MQTTEVSTLITHSPSPIADYLVSTRDVVRQDGILTCPISNPSFTIQANSYYFGHPEWALGYFEACHRDENFITRWQRAIDSWQDKVVVDIGCGPGNIYASLGGPDKCGVPRTLIGVDVSLGGLKMAKKVGYTPLLADAQDLPLVSGFADIVVVNATLHHCEDMIKVLAEAARLVRPGGLLITDHDPHFKGWNFKGLAFALWQARLPLYRLMKRGGHASAEEQRICLATEIHHDAGDGLIPEDYYQTLEPLGFTVTVYPHNNTLGATVLEGQRSPGLWKYRLAQRLSGIDPDSVEGALTLMCIARRASH